MNDLGLIFSHADVRAFANEFVWGGECDHLVVSFSAWNPNGNGVPFGPGFFHSRRVPAIFIVQHKNHWWHTDALHAIASRVREIAADRARGIVCYGSSMGGYGSLHFSSLFHATRSIAIAPQIFISDAVIPEETRWAVERKKVELQFDEVRNLRDVRCNSYIFYDSRHAQDSLHVERLRSVGVGAQFHALEVPFALHDVARALVKVQEFKDFVVKHHRDDNFDIDRLRVACASAHQFDDKVFLNRLRHVPVKNIIDSEKTRLLNVISDNTKILDFEALYFAAEGLMRLGLHQEALDCSTRSLEKYPMKVLPRYLELKHERVRKAFESAMHPD
ncbi:hypothetical protein [Cupriavidus sp. IK-TO18]|uniref:hypothetical protein n=1 Tax=Cupriavidus sp. IK-TO18 TaxID=2782182 RepID=UPI00189B6134|nr:hypothetical protein [Cupriavidus sp. IK-TO18]MBF6987017.1 hypothetical protein [Cupriavidus sp. IK-TO18]